MTVARTPAVVALLLLAAPFLAAPGAAAPLALENSAIEVRFSGLPLVEFGQTQDSLILNVSSGAGDFVLPAGILAGMVSIPNQQFTGSSLITSLRATGTNGTLFVNGAAGTASGVLVGQAVIGVLGGLVNLTVPISAGGGGTALAGAAALVISVSNGVGWTTGVVSVTGLSTSTPGTAVVSTTAFLSGSDARSVGHQGMISLVTPVRVLTNAAGALPLFITARLSFVPEPGVLLLLASSAGLIALGAARRRR